MKSLIPALIFSLFTVSAFAADIIVKADGTGDYPTIQAAINNANDGDVIILLPGTFTGSDNWDIDFLSRAITVRSTDPNDHNIVENTIIDCENQSGHRGFYIHSGEEPNSIIEGLTIKQGSITGSPAKGGGILCDNSSPTIKNCIITDNKSYGTEGTSSVPDGAPAFGGGIYCQESTANIINCQISDNEARGGNGVSYDEYNIPDGGISSGGGIYCDPGSNCIITNCVLSNNRAQGGSAGMGPGVGGWSGESRGGGICGPSTITNCLIFNNDAVAGGAIESDRFAYAYGGGISDNPLTIRNCTITGNYAEGEGMGSYSLGGGISEPVWLFDSIVWGNTSLYNNYPNIYGAVEVFYCDVQWSGVFPGIGNINADPLFVTGPLGDYYLSQIAAGQASDSPCVDAGSDTAANLGMDLITTRTDGEYDSGTVDMGYHYVDINTPVLEVLPLGLGFLVNLIEGGTDPNSQTITVRNLGTEPLYWTATIDANWLSLDINSGVCPSFNDSNTVVVDVNIEGMTQGIYDANIIIFDPCALNSPQAVLVRFEVIDFSIADFDNDFVVDFNDFAILASQWFLPPGIPSADIAPPGGDGVVDLNDLDIFCQNWLDGTQVNIPNLVSHWKFDEGSGDIAYDSAGTNHGTIQGAAWATGKIGDFSLQFDGQNDSVDTPMNLDLSQAWTVSIWIKSNEMTPGGIFNLGGSYESGKIRIESRNDYNYGGFRFRYSSDPPNSLISTPVVNEGGWHHIVWQQDGGSVGSTYAVYVDGEIIATRTVPTSKYAVVPFRIGWEGTSGYYNGTLDDVRIYNRALTQGEINQLYLMGN